MCVEWKGKVIRLHTEEGAEDLGRIVHVGRDQSVVYWIPFPHTRPRREEDDAAEKSAKVFHLQAPRQWPTDDLRLKLSERGGSHTLVHFVEPTAWRYTDQELRQGFALRDLGEHHRRNTRAWLQKRDELKRWINPIVTSFSLYELLELGRLNDEVRARAKELGHKNPTRVARAMRKYLIGCGDPNALLPAWSESGCAGKVKFPKKKCGRRPRRVRRGRSTNAGFVRSEASLAFMVAGWRKYKRHGTTEYKAYLLTCEEYWPGNQDATDSDGNRYRLAPPECRPTFGEFRYAAVRAKLSATAANMSKRVHNLVARAFRGKFDDGIVAVGQLGLIDSTSEDQTPVSRISRLKVLPSTWRTIVMEGKTEYILGLHSGFECPSTMTSLLAICNAGDDKVAFCAGWGVTIQPDQWHSMNCKRIRGDHGELKSELGITTLNVAECTAEFVRLYRGDQKGPVEAGHHSMHRRADHDVSGSTRGKQQERGEPRVADQACRTHRENMPFVIRSILFHNNEELVPKLLTMDMRRDEVIPTRKAIFEWYIKNGYVASEPSNMDLLRTRCLPRIAARMYRDGIHLIDPSDTQERARLIPQLNYSSNWLIGSGLQEKAGRGVLQCEVMLDPNDLSRCYFDHGGKLHELQRQTSDPRANELTLFEHLMTAEDDRDLAEDLQGRLQEAELGIVSDNRRANVKAKAAKRQEQETAPKKPGKQPRNKLQHRRDELRRTQLEALGFDPDALNGPRPHEGQPCDDTHSQGVAPSYRSGLLAHLASQWRNHG